MNYLTVAGGASPAKGGFVSVASSLPTDVNSLLQAYLSNVADSIDGGKESYIYNNVADGTVQSSIISGSSNTYELISNLNDVGNSVKGSGAYAVTVPSSVTQLVVEASGTLTITGSAKTDFALFGATSNVDYTVSSPGAGSIVAAGGNDTINVLGAKDDQTVTSGGNDIITFNGTNGVESVNAVGNATTSVFLGGSDAATVTASDNAQVEVKFLNAAGGNLDFINNSSQVATVFSGVYTVGSGTLSYAPNAVTAFGGSAGLFAVGGRAGYNSLNGGTGSSTLVGAGDGDTLVGGGKTNLLFAGGGSETLLGSGAANIFEVGFQEPGIGAVTTDGGLVSAGGASANIFGLGNVNATTLVGSTVQGSTNNYVINGSFTTLGGQVESVNGGSLQIEDFGGNSTISLVNPTSAGLHVESIQGALTGGTQILLSDNTVITLTGVSQNQINVGQNGTVITFV